MPFWGHFEAFGDLSGYFWGWGGGREVFLGLLIRTDNFYFVRFFVFLFFHFLPFWVHFGPFWALSSYFRGGGGVQNFFELYVYRLTTFVF